MQDLIKLHQAFNHIRYYDKDHTYVDTRTGEELVSCTTFIKRFKSEFNKGYWLNKKAKEYGITAEQLDSSWEQSRIVGATRGKMIHSIIEDSYANKEFPLEYSRYIQNLETLDFINFHKSLEKLRIMFENFKEDHPNLIPIKSELVVGDTDIKIAGQVDQVFFNTNDNAYYIVDWKNDKRIEAYNQYNKKFKKPISHLDDCEINKYSLQTSMYRYIIEKNTGIQIKDSVCVWLNYNNDNYEVFTLKYLHKELEDMISYD